MPKLKLHWWILIGIVLGFISGWVVLRTFGAEAATDSAAYQAFDGISKIFLNLLKLIVVPLVFFSLVGGLIAMGDPSRLGRLGLRTFGLYIGTTLLACTTGLLLVNLIKPGVGLSIAVPTQGVDKQPPESFWEVIVNMVPQNVVEAASQMDMLGVILFAILFGACLLTLDGETSRTMTAFIDGGAEIMMRMTGFIISLAPIGVAALIARLIVQVGDPAKLLQMGWYVGTVSLGLATHALLTLPLLMWLITRRNPYRYLWRMTPALLTGFSTASSSGTLGVTLERAEHHGGISNRVASFVLPLGATVNMDGTALYEIVSVLFIAQMHAGVDPSFSLGAGQQLLIVFLGLTVSIGAAGIPHAGLVMMVIILEAVGLPVEYAALIWSVDRLLDMCRTATNIASDSMVTMIVAHGEGEVVEPTTDS